jgi:hypothetical protein
LDCRPRRITFGSGIDPSAALSVKPQRRFGELKARRRERQADLGNRFVLLGSKCFIGSAPPAVGNDAALRMT